MAELTPKEKCDEIIDYISNSHLKAYGKVFMNAVINEASANVVLVIKSRLIDGLDVTYWRKVKNEIELRRN
jgi:regulator of sigma D